MEPNDRKEIHIIITINNDPMDVLTVYNKLSRLENDGIEIDGDQVMFSITTSHCIGSIQELITTLCDDLNIMGAVKVESCYSSM